jgi:peptidoglycan/LPS O-acetylase OafA/YrhL
MALAADPTWGREIVGDGGTRRLLADLGEVLYAWLMTFGLMGLCEAALHSERPRVRYVSDSSYWLYLVHLPLIIVGQMLLRDVDLPALVKLAALLGVASAILLLSYRSLVRYTWIGRMLNGPRTRPEPREAVERPSLDDCQSSKSP